MIVALRRGIVFAFGAVAILGMAPVASAAEPTTDNLNPPPPRFLTCKPADGGTICAGTRERVVDPQETFVCGDGAAAFTVYDQGLEHQRLTLWYDDGGYLERILNHERWTSAFWSNPLTGATVPYTQSNVITTTFAVPGDFSTATETTVGEVIFTDPQTGEKVLRSVGRAAIAPDGTLFLSGKQPFFAEDPSVFDGLCAALAS